MRRNPREFLDELTEDAALLAEQAGVQFRAQIEPEGEAAFDAQWMRQALLNLLTNAFRYSGRGSLVTLDSEFTLDAWRLTVEDEGPGVPEADRGGFLSGSCASTTRRSVERGPDWGWRFAGACWRCMAERSVPGRAGERGA